MELLRGCDVAIVGGGLVGSALACALDGHGLDVVLIEAQARASSATPDADGGAAPLDRRNLALARRSVETLDRIGIWPHVAAHAVGIRSVHVSRRGDFGALRLAAGDHRLQAFGSTVPAPRLGEALESRLGQCTALRRVQPARLGGWRSEEDCLHLSIERAGVTTPVTLPARLLVAADGSESAARTHAGIAVTRRDYAQTAIVGSVALDREHEGRAYERFVDDGLVAMLPLAGRTAGFVWVQATAAAAFAVTVDDAAFLSGLQQAFGWRLGAFRRIGRRQAWPLHAVTAKTLVAARFALVGNAAQTVHPVGAQGFNLGLRDAVSLAEEVIAAHAAGLDAGRTDTLRRYQQRRMRDRNATLATSDTLVDLFGASGGLLGVARSVAMAIAERSPPIKRGLASRGMGYRPEGSP